MDGYVGNLSGGNQPLRANYGKFNLNVDPRGRLRCFRLKFPLEMLPDIYVLL
jgi:hypothetical protein